MSEQNQAGTPLNAVEQALRQELAHGDVVIGTARPILRHLLANADQALFSDEVIATVRGMMTHLARQMLFTHAAHTDTTDPAQFVTEHQGGIVGELLGDADFLAFAHTLTVEGQLALRLSQRSGIDPVLSPLLQELAASKDSTIAGDAMRVLSAQARYMQQLRRMELPIGELPEKLFERAIALFMNSAASNIGDSASAVRAMRKGYEADDRRIGQITRLIASMQNTAKRALEVDHAGLSIFVTAVAMASEQKRETVILSLGENQATRLAISLRAAGLGQAAVIEQFLFLHPEMDLPEGLETIRSEQAATMLSDTEIKGTS